MGNATEKQRRELVELIRSGQLLPYHPRAWHELSEEQAAADLVAAKKNAPFSLKILDRESKNMLKSFSERHLLTIYAEDYRYLTQSDADKLIKIGTDVAKRNPQLGEDILEKILHDRNPASDFQREQIIALVKEGYLKPTDYKTWANLSNIEARKMIFLGENNRQLRKKVYV